ncbi:unnamed protein product [Amoebophrya sp. A120]|nr:unnamed protein product [Amoebophrya sp. A120]|eukprot:GSA120T00006990001.1
MAEQEEDPGAAEEPAPPPELFHTTSNKEPVEVAEYVSDDGSEPRSEDINDDVEEAEEEAALDQAERLRELERRCRIAEPDIPLQTGTANKPERDTTKGDPLAKYQDGRSGVFSTHQYDAELKETVADKRTVQILRDLRNNWDKKCEAAEDARQVLASEESKLKEMQSTRSAEEIFVQADEVERSWQRLSDLEKERDAAELRLHSLMDKATDAERRLLQKEYEQSIIAQKRQQDEVTRGNRIIDKMWQDDYLKAEKKAAVKAEKDRKQSEAEKHRKKNNKEFLLPAIKDAEQKNAQSAAVRDAKWNHRTKAMLQLKKNLNDINARIASTNESKAKKKLQEDKEKKIRELELLEQGLNPYEVFRREQVEDDLAKKKVEGAALKQMRNEKLLNNLIREDNITREKEAEHRRRKEFEIAYQREMAGQSKDVKIRDYIKKVTLNHVEILDATGNAMRIDPSKLTAFKSGGFGLGQAPPEELAAVEEKLAFQQKRVAYWDAEDAAKADDGMGFLEDSAAADGQATPKKREDGKLWMPSRTVLEEKMLVKAKQEHRDFIDLGQEQHCWGKVFKGQAFIPSPKIIEYLDFEANSTYKQTIEVTNVSLTFNQFKLLPMDDKILDFFEIGFDPPGRMSAGVSCKIQLKFAPKLYKDIWTTFPILAKTGRIDFPVMCLTKKTVLDLEPKELTEEEKMLLKKAAKTKQKIPKKMPPDPAVPPEQRDENYYKDPSENLFIDFGSVVFGEWSTKQVTIVNYGALPAGYSIRESVIEDEPKPPLDRKNEFRTTRMLTSDPWKTLRPQEESEGSGDCGPLASEVAIQADDPTSADGAAEEKGEGADDTEAAGAETTNPQEGGTEGLLDSSQGTAAATTKLETNAASSSSTNRKPVPLPEQLAFQAEGNFVGRGNSKIEFVFTPKHLGEFSCKFVIEVDNKAPGDARFKKTYFLKCVGKCVDVPIYVEREIYNLHTILFEHTFRELIVLKNRSQVAMKIKVERPALNDPRLKENEIQINPTTAFVQGLGEQAIQFKLVLQRDFLERNPQYKRDETIYGPAAFKIPVKVVGADQVLPVFTCVTGNLTQNDITFEPENLDFGNCYVDGARYKSLKLTNHSKLPQNVCFANLPNYLSITNMAKDARDQEEKYGVDSKKSAVTEHGGNGFLTQILPDETVPLTCIYQPTSATEMKTALQIHTQTGNLCGRNFQIPVTGQGKMVKLELSQNFLKFPAIAVGAQGKESFEITNVTKNKSFEISVLQPPKYLARLWICPVCKELKPGEKTRVQIEFKPNLVYSKMLRNCEQDMDELAEEVANGISDLEPATDAAGDTSPSKTQHDEETKEKITFTEQEIREKTKSEIVELINTNGGRRWEHRRRNDTGQEILQKQQAVSLEMIDSQHCLWKIPILVRPVVEVDAKRVYLPDEKCDQISIAVKTTTVPSVLVPTPSNCDFGEVTVFERKLIHVTVRCKVDAIQEIHMTKPLPETQCFTVLNACYNRFVKKEKQFQIVIEFNPQAAQLYQTVLNLHTEETRIRIPLKGYGVTPRLYLKNQYIHFPGAVHHTDSCVSEKISFFNTTRFLLEYSISKVSQNFVDNFQGAPAFMLEPMKGKIAGKATDDAPDTELQVEAKFRPHRPSELFLEKQYVFVPNQDFPTYVYLYGHSFLYQMYVIYDLTVEQLPSNMTAPSQFEDGLNQQRFAETDLQKNEPDFPNPQRKQFDLTFEESATELTQYLIFGCCATPTTAPDPKVCSAGNFEITIEDPKYFQCGEAKGTIPAGQRTSTWIQHLVFVVSDISTRLRFQKFRVDRKKILTKNTRKTHPLHLPSSRGHANNDRRDGTFLAGRHRAVDADAGKNHAVGRLCAERRESNAGDLCEPEGVSPDDLD